ncbi:MFS transporter [Pseudonocardia sp. C8]|uniref:MFS transporter n=1 Tax=Pseudonocardia sp. C8 TaxID=2762759 RepID=UPI0016434CD8|nr:MFS transporter [Pseudonocardia sp. C8]
MTTTPAPPRHRIGLLSVVLGLLFGLAGTSTSGVTVALPGLADGLGVTTAAATWMVSGYAVALAVAVPVHGRLADAVGIRGPLCAGTALLGIGALAAALAPSFPLLMIARVVQGLGAASVPVLAPALLTARLPDGRRGAALGRLAGTSAVLAAMGPLIGGALTTAGGWRAAVALPVVGLLAVPYLWWRSAVPGDGARLDLAGAAIVATAVSGLVLLIQSPSAGTAAAVTGAVLLVLGVPATAAWVRFRPDGFLPRAVISNVTVVLSSLCAMAIPASWFALLLGIPLALAERGWTPLTTGLVLVPSAVVALACPPLSALLQRRLGPTRTLLVACVVTTVGLFAAVAGVAWHQPWVLAIAPTLVTLAFGTGQPGMVAAVGGAVPEERRSGAIGVATLCFLTGAGIGAAVIGGFATVLGLAPALALLLVLPVAGAVALLVSGKQG